jgi:energy-coupling factor transporter ATP-binding protein EcfA2
MEFTERTLTAYKQLTDTFRSIKVDQITVLTGSNGSGKSLIRKQLPFLIKEYYGFDDNKQLSGIVLSTSMEARTALRSEFGALSSTLHDTGWIATSSNTLNSIKNLFNVVKDTKKKVYLVIDEFEIGCGEETILALTNFINRKLFEFALEDKLLGALIITHSRLGVKNLEMDSFVNIQGLSKDEWLNRKIEPANLDDLEKNELFFYIRDNKE